MSYVARLGLRGRQRAGQHRSLSSSTDKLGDAVYPILIEVVSRMVAQKLTRLEQHWLSDRRPATGIGG